VAAEYQRLPPESLHFWMLRFEIDDRMLNVDDNYPGVTNSDILEKAYTQALLMLLVLGAAFRLLTLLALLLQKYAYSTSLMQLIAPTLKATLSKWHAALFASTDAAVRVADADAAELLLEHTMEDELSRVSAGRLTRRDLAGKLTAALERAREQSSLKSDKSCESASIGLESRCATLAARARSVRHRRTSNGRTSQHRGPPATLATLPSGIALVDAESSVPKGIPGAPSSGTVKARLAAFNEAAGGGAGRMGTVVAYLERGGVEYDAVKLHHLIAEVPAIRLRVEADDYWAAWLRSRDVLTGARTALIGSRKAPPPASSRGLRESVAALWHGRWSSVGPTQDRAPPKPLLSAGAIASADRHHGSI